MKTPHRPLFARNQNFIEIRFFHVKFVAQCSLIILNRLNILNHWEFTQKYTEWLLPIVTEEESKAWQIVPSNHELFAVVQVNTEM